MERCTLMSELYRRMQTFIGDEEQLIVRMAGQMSLWEECVLLFPGEEIIKEMDAALAAREEKEFYGTVHRLKGNLANFGFDSAATKAMAVLQALKVQDWDTAKERYGQLKEEYLQIIERIGDAE
ncbi:MAG: Hpt domain-containing protein [Lachnospiraceae bacterium]|nr:Hpt domain-containing protein [Lachnospiraceae bacterium]